MIKSKNTGIHRVKRLFKSIFQVQNEILKISLTEKNLNIEFGVRHPVYSSEAAWCAGFKAEGGCARGVYRGAPPCVWVCI